jgi:hypothetical protein
VDQQNSTALESNKQILAASLEARHGLAHELGGDRQRVMWPGQASVLDLDVLERPPDEEWFEADPDRLDLR